MKETELAEKLGISRGVLMKYRRQMLNKSDWRREKNFIVYTREGLEALLAILDRLNGRGDVAAAKLRDLVLCKKKRGPRFRGLTVHRIYERNPKFLEAKLGRFIQRVRVRENKNFRAGMTLKARYLGNKSWTMEGRCPRWWGRW